MREREQPDCRKCGVCCWSTQDDGSYCDVTAQDIERLGTWAKKNVEMFSPFDYATYRYDTGDTEICGAVKTAWKKMRSGPFKGVEACVCVALTGSLMHKVRCSIYQKRPHTCRTALKPGDRACLELRKMFFRAMEEEKTA